MHDDRIYRHTGTLLEFLVIVRRIRAAMGFPRCDCLDHGGTGAMWAPCPCGPTGLGADVDRTCPHVTLRPTRVVRIPGGDYGIRVNDAVFSRLTAGEKSAVEPVDAAWEAAPEVNDA